MAWLEIETKIKVSNSEIPKLKERIRKIGKFQKKILKSDEYFAIQKNKKKYPRKSFRIRKAGNKFQINFKKHLKNYSDKEIVVKKEFEFTLSNKNELENLLALFKDLNFKKWIKKIKHNETYLWKKDKRVSIEFNKVEKLGNFIEIEYLAKDNEIKKAKSKIRQVLKELEINLKNIDNTGYTKMLWRKKNPKTL